MTVSYSIDSGTLCRQYEEIYSYITDELYLRVSCDHPPTFIRNDGQIEINDIQVDVVIENETSYQYSYVQYEYISVSGVYSFLYNTNRMEISCMLVTRTVGNFFMVNSGDLIMSNVSFGWHQDVYDPNALQSNLFVIQVVATSSMYVYDSDFVGGHIQIYAAAGSIEIINCTFERAIQAMNLYMVNEAVIQDSLVKNTGPLYGTTLAEADGYSFNPSLKMIIIEDATVSNNIFWGYNADALVYMRYVTNTIVINNTFNVNDEELFYNVSSVNIGFNWGYVSAIRDSTYGQLIGNQFLQNKVDADTPWFELERVVSVCVAGNNFTNFGIYANDTMVTSCFRSQLIDCIDAYNDSDCSNGLYGYMEAALFNVLSVFVVDDLSNDGTIIAGDRSMIALDNVKIISNNNSQPFINITDGQLLLVDAYITSSVISYNVDACNMIYKEHLKSNMNYISRLLMHCDASHSTHIKHETALVNHLSVSNINISASAGVYYPGDLLIFEYHTTDILHNIVEYDGINTTVYLKHGSFLGTLNIENSKCRNCESGLLLSDVSLNNIGDKYSMDVLVENRFQSTYTTLSVHIVACPIGFCPDNKDYHCQKCNTDYYSVLPNNTNECLPCNPLLNPGVKCDSGSIRIKEYYWMGFDGDNIISGLCPLSHCCSKQNGCNYIRDDKYILCAENRDHNSVLCGKCQKGFSESMTSTKCIKCSKPIYIGYLLLPFALSLVIGIVLLMINRRLSVIQIMILNCVLYYEQSISVVLRSTKSSSLLNLCQLFASIFNLSIVSNTNIIGDTCFVDGLGAKGKILMDLFIPITLPIMIALLYLIFKYILKKKVFIAQTFIIMFLIIFGKIFDVLFKLLSCVKLSEDVVHFYFGEEECFGATLIVSIIIFALIFVGFAAAFIKLRMMTPNQRNNLNQKHILYSLTSRYTQRYYYWEFIIFIRRIIIAAFSVMIHDMTSRLIFVAIIIFYVYLQQTVNPFIINEVNNMEFILLWCLMFVILSQFPFTFQLNEIFINVAIAALTLCPIPLLIYYVLKVAKGAVVVDKIQVPDDEEYDIYIGDPKFSINSIEMKQKQAEM